MVGIEQGRASAGHARMIGDCGALPVAPAERYTGRMDARPPQVPGRLPPPPAPTARDANPWTFSDTARAAGPREPTGLERLVAGLEEAQAARTGPTRAQPAAAAERPPSPGAPRRESALRHVVPLVILLVMFASIAREMIEAGGRDPSRLLFVAVALLVAVTIVVLLALRVVRRRARRG
jgi:hypothetical protein